MESENKLEERETQRAESVAPSESAPLVTQATSPECPWCGPGEIDSMTVTDVDSSFVYAIGRIEPRFKNLGSEKEYAQATGRTTTEGLTDRQVFSDVMQAPENRYLLRHLCWVFTVEGLETYILWPRGADEYSMLLDTIRGNPDPGDIDIVIGRMGPVAPPSLCNGLTVNLVLLDQTYSFDRSALLGSLPKPEKAEASAFEAAANELLDRVLQITDNAGSSDEHRALNYLVVRYPAVYERTYLAFGRGASLERIDVKHAALNSTRRVLEVVLTYVDRQTDVKEMFSALVDVTDEFPFMVRKLSSYIDR